MLLKLALELQLLLCSGIVHYVASQDTEAYVIVDASWYPHALDALDCLGAEELLLLPREADTRLCLENTTNLTLSRSDAETTQFMSGLAQSFPQSSLDSGLLHQGPLLVVVSQNAAAVFNALPKEQLLIFRRAVLIHNYMAQETLRICSISGNFLFASAVACFGFELSYAGFLVGAAAALVPWTKRAVGFISDVNDPFANDYVFKAITNGVKYIDPSLSVIRRHVRVDDRNGREFASAVYAEVDHLLDDVSVIYMDLSSRASVTSALAAVEGFKEVRVVSHPFAILPPTFQGFLEDGAPDPQFSKVTLNAMSIDMGRAIKQAVAYKKGVPPIGTTLLKAGAGFVSTLWTQPYEPVQSDSRWLNAYKGSFDRLTQGVHELAMRSCGTSYNTVEFLNSQVADVMKSNVVDERQDGTCEVTSDCCAPSQPPSLKHSWNPALRCGPGLCGTGLLTATESYPRSCLGNNQGYHGCPRGDTNSVKILGLGVYVNNIAELSMASGSFFVDFNVYVFEQWEEEGNLNKSEDRLLVQETRECNPNALQKSKSFKDAQEFWDMLQLVGTDRWLTAFPVATEDDVPPVVNIRGWMYFETNLHDWPFDRQNLDLAFDVAAVKAREKVRMCIMSSYSTFSSNIRLAGVRTANADVLVMDPKVSTVCWGPFLYPKNRCKKFASDVPSALCVECEDESVVSIPGHADETCKCMGGARASDRAVFSIRFQRPPGRMLIQIFLPPVAIIALNQAVLWLRVQASETRVLMSSSACVASVMYHVTISASTPPTAREITKADILMMICYGVNLAILLTALMQYLAYFAGDEELQVFVDKVWYPRSRILVTLLTFFFGGSIFFLDAVWQIVLFYIVLAAIYTVSVLSSVFDFFKLHPRKKDELKLDIQETLRKLSFHGSVKHSFASSWREPVSHRPSHVNLPIREDQPADHIELADVFQPGGSSSDMPQKRSPHSSHSSKSSSSARLL